MPFFTPGITIATPRGPVAVERLQPGDKVVTRDNGLQSIVWAGRRTFDFAALKVTPHLRPVLIRRGALGPGLPERDMMVSPNARLLVSPDRTPLPLAPGETLVAAKNLAEARDIRQVDVLGVTYLHMTFTRHEVVLANGAWAECFQPADTSLGAQGNAQRGEIRELFPDLDAGQRARRGARVRLRLRREGLVVEFGRADGAGQTAGGPA